MTFSKRLDQDEHIRLTHTSSNGVFKTSSRRLDQDQYNRLGHTSSRRLAKKSSKRLQDVFKTSCKNVFKTSSRRLQDVLQRSLQDVLKTYHQVKLFLLASFQNDTYSNVSETYCKEIHGQCINFPRVTKVSQILVPHFTTPFSDRLQRRI